MRLVMFALTVVLCACGREPSFDERYSNSEDAIQERAREFDEELNDPGANGSSADETATPLR